MKKIAIVIIAVTSMLIAIASCSKTHTCRCTYPDGNYDDYPVVSDSRGPADKACAIWQDRYESSMGVACKIK